MNAGSAASGGARGGARAQARSLSTRETSSGVFAISTMRNRPPQRSHFKMSTVNTRMSSQGHGCLDGSAVFFAALFADVGGSSHASNSGSCAGNAAGSCAGQILRYGRRRIDRATIGI